jgi:16S rRNA (cytosine967-C5)-methyltransferase
MNDGRRPGAKRAQNERRPRDAAAPLAPKRSRSPGRLSPRPRAAVAGEGADPPRIACLVVDSLAQLLSQVLRFDGPADAVMSRYFKLHAKLGSRDRSLVAEAVFFALRRYASLRWIMQPAHPGRAPRLAALVTLARQHGIDALDPRALRNDERAVRHALATRVDTAPRAVQAEVPQWLYQRIASQYGDADALLAALAAPAPLDLRVNTQRSSRDAVLAELRSSTPQHAPLEAEPTPYSPEGIRLFDKPGLTRWPLYQHGSIEVQDEGSQLIARLVAPRRGEMVVDFCAGAGGKTLALGSLMRSTGRIYAFDIHARRLAGLGPRLKRSGLSNVHPAAIASENDLRVKRLAGKIDRVLVDAPCSGSGTLRRNPDLKWRFDEAELARVNGVQQKVLRAAARLLKPGGRLVYATCSLLAEENQGVVERFLAGEPQFALVPADDVLRAQGIAISGLVQAAPFFVMLPQLHGTDGFFAAVMQLRA